MVLNPNKGWWRLGWFLSGILGLSSVSLLALAPFTYGGSILVWLGYSASALSWNLMDLSVIIGVTGAVAGLGLLHYAKNGAKGSGFISLGVVGLLACIAVLPLSLVSWSWAIMPLFLGALGIATIIRGCRFSNDDNVYEEAPSFCDSESSEITHFSKRTIMETTSELQAPVEEKKRSSDAFEQAYDCILKGKFKTAQKKFADIAKTSEKNEPLFALMWLNYLGGYDNSAHQSSPSFRFFKNSPQPTPFSEEIRKGDPKKLQELQESKEPSAHVGRFLGYIYVQGIGVAQNPKVASEYFTRVLKHQDDDFFSLEQRSVAYAQLENYFGAIEDIEQAIKLIALTSPLQGKYQKIRQKYIVEYQQQKKTSAVQNKLAMIQMLQEQDKSRYFELDLRGYSLGPSDIKALSRTIETNDKITRLLFDEKFKKAPELTKQFQQHLLKLDAITPQQLREIDWNKLTKKETIALLNKIKDWRELDLSQRNLSSSTPLFLLETSEFPRFNNLVSLNLNHNPEIRWPRTSDTAETGQNKLLMLFEVNKFPQLQRLYLSNCGVYSYYLKALLNLKTLQKNLTKIELCGSDLESLKSVIGGFEKNWKGPALSLDVSDNILAEELDQLLENPRFSAGSSDSKESMEGESAKRVRWISYPKKVQSQITTPGITKPRFLSDKQWLLYLLVPKALGAQHIECCIEGLTPKGRRILRIFGLGRCVDPQTGKESSTTASAYEGSCQYRDWNISFDSCTKAVLVAKITPETGNDIFQEIKTRSGEIVPYHVLESVYAYAASWNPSSPRKTHNCVTWLFEVLKKHGINLPFDSGVPSRIYDYAIARAREAQGKVPKFPYSPPAKLAPVLENKTEQSSASGSSASSSSSMSTSTLIEQASSSISLS